MKFHGIILTSNIPTCQRGLEQVGGAHPPVAAAPAGTYQGMQFVDEEDRGSRRRLLDQLLYAFLEVATEFHPRHQARQVDGYHTESLPIIRHNGVGWGG